MIGLPIHRVAKLVLAAFIILHNGCSGATKIIGFSCNIGMPPMVGRQKNARGDLYADCDPYKVGFCVRSDVPAFVPLVVKGAAGNWKFWGTSYHINGYWGLKNAQFVMTRAIDPLAFHQPMVSDTNPSSPRKHYKFTFLDYIFMAQNVYTDYESLELFKNSFQKSGLESLNCNHGSLIEFSLSQAETTGPMIGCKRGKTQLANYIFDACHIAGGNPSSLWSKPAECFDLKELGYVDKLQTLRDGMIASTTKCTTQVIDFNFFQSAFVSLCKQELPNIQIVDYFNNDPDIDFYIPIHITDPGTTNVGFDEEIKQSNSTNIKSAK